MPQSKTTAKKRPASSKPRQLIAAEDTPGADGLPPAPLKKLTLDDTKRRLKVIIGRQSGEDPKTISDDSPVARPNILLFRLRSAINRHFFPKPLNGIVGFPAGETVIQLARRIKTTRDPQIKS